MRLKAGLRSRRSSGKMRPVSAPTGPGATNAEKSTAMPVSSLTEAEFDNAVAKGVCVLDFWAPWCGPCRMQGPIFESVAADFEKNGKPVRFYKVNVDEEPALAGRFGVQSIPTLVVTKDGEEAAVRVGVTPAAVLADLVEKA